MQSTYLDYQTLSSEMEFGTGKVKVQNQLPIMEKEEQEKAQKAIKETLYEVFSKYM